MDSVQKPSNSECYTPSSEPFRIYLHVYETLFEQSERKISLERISKTNLPEIGAQLLASKDWLDAME
jgi:hypothetical protein